MIQVDVVISVIVLEFLRFSYVHNLSNFIMMMICVSTRSNGRCGSLRTSQDPLNEITVSLDIICRRCKIVIDVDVYVVIDKVMIHTVRFRRDSYSCIAVVGACLLRILTFL
jgi:hypothetical protein